MNKRIFHIPIFVPHKGCPHDCVFCNQRKITGVEETDDLSGIRETVESHLGSIDSAVGRDGAYIEIAFFGGSFTAIDFSRQEELMKLANEYLISGRIDAIRCSTRPDCITDEILDMLSHYGMSVIELGVQSTDDEVLRLSARGHTYEDVKKAAALIRSRGMSLGLQMMTGLPGDTADKSIKTAGNLISLSPDCVRIYPTLVVEDTKLNDMYEKGEYTPFTLEETVDLCAKLVKMFERSRIDIIRMGLQTTDNINENTVRGPYHAALRELVIGRIIRDCIETNFDSSANELTVTVCPSLVSAAAGHKRVNKEYFLQKYSTRLKVTADSSLDSKHISISGKTVDIYE